MVAANRVSRTAVQRNNVTRKRQRCFACSSISSNYATAYIVIECSLKHPHIEDCFFLLTVALAVALIKRPRGNTRKVYALRQAMHARSLFHTNTRTHTQRERGYHKPRAHLMHGCEAKQPPKPMSAFAFVVDVVVVQIGGLAMFFFRCSVDNACISIRWSNNNNNKKQTKRA